jgi:cytochrome b
MNLQTLGKSNTRQSVPVWDLFVRVFHWSVVFAFTGAYVLSDDGGALHHAFGYVVLGLVAARIAWGFTGTQHARFSSFVPQPRVFVAYCRDIAAGRERRYHGHNPAGGAMIVVLLTLLVSTGVSGWLLTSDMFWGSKALEALHEICANAVLACAVIHVGGVLLASWRHRENLVGAMFSGRKRRD